MSAAPSTHPTPCLLTRIAEVQRLRRERWRALMEDHTLARVVRDAVVDAAPGRFDHGSLRETGCGVPDLHAWAEHFARLDPDSVWLTAARDALAATDVATPLRIGQVLAQYDLATVRHARERNGVVLDNLGLAHLFVARCLRHESSHRADLLQEAAIGLIRAIERFDVERGTQFSTYAMYWIRHAVLHAMDEGRDVVRLPGHVRAARRKIAGVTRECSATTGSSPALTELAARLALSEHVVARAATRAIDLGQREFGDDPPEDAWIDRLDRERFETRLEAAVAELEPKAQSILSARFGLTRQRASLAAVAAEHGMSHEGVRQVALRTIQRLRGSLGLAPRPRPSNERPVARPVEKRRRAQGRATRAARAPAEIAATDGCVMRRSRLIA
jgi:RNA polymerase primary sigma factor